MNAGCGRLECGEREIPRHRPMIIGRCRCSRFVPIPLHHHSLLVADPPCADTARSPPLLPRLSRAPSRGAKPRGNFFGKSEMVEVGGVGFDSLHLPASRSSHTLAASLTCIVRSSALRPSTPHASKAVCLLHSNRGPHGEPRLEVGGVEPPCERSLTPSVSRRVAVDGIPHALERRKMCMR